MHVVYGMVGLKTHAKTCLVVRRENGGIRRYAHIGTGNYNPKTARLYEDLGLLTCDPDLGADLTDLFNLLTGYSRQREYRRLLVAPVTMRPGLADLIRRETEHDDGSIVLKMNSLVDADLIDALYEASQAGVRVDLLIRGICCLRPGVPGLSEGIRVRSIVGRFLEHSRVYRFGGPTRGLRLPDRFGRLDAAQPRPPGGGAHARSRTAPCRRGSTRSCAIGLEDDELAWELGPDGRWHKVPTIQGVNIHRALQESAVERSELRSVNLEREVKLAVGPLFRLPDLSDLARRGLAPQDEGAQRFVTSYHDTKDLRLARWGASLRYRTGEGWTVKLPQPDGPLHDLGVIVRQEHTFDAGPGQATGTGARPGPRIRAIGARVVVGAVADGPPTHRAARTPRTAPVAEVVDDEVSVLDGRRVVGRFRELEVELAPDADDAILRSALGRLRQGGR